MIFSQTFRLASRWQASGSHDKFLAVLHPRLFSVYGIKKKESKESTEGYVGDQVIIELAYQHTLRHSAYSFLLGPFGGVRGRDFICIQSLDGLLSFYEQESFAFQLYLPTFILPHPFTYLDKTDSFLFLNDLFIFDCYTYEALASAGSSNEKKIIKTWEYNLGEVVLSIKTLKKDGLIVVILTERSFLALNEHGKLVFMKRIDYKPVAHCSYLTYEDRRLMTIIATDAQFLHLYENTNLKWTLKLDMIPVSLGRIFLNDLPGGLVLLSEDGYLQCVYIGTHPSVYLVPVLAQPEINVQKAEAELRELQKKIADNDLMDPVTAELVTFDIRVDKTFTTDESGLRKCNVTAEVSAQSLIPKLQVMIFVEPPLVAVAPCSRISNFCEKTLVDSYVHLGKEGVVSSLEVRVIVSYVTNEGVARCIEKTGVLPLGLVMCECPAVKEALHKLTISTNKPVCAMNQLFRELTTEESQPNVIGLKYLNSEDVVTILAAKSSQRYRIQSDSLPAITLLLVDLLKRLKQNFRRESDFTLTYSTTLPLEGYYEAIKQHHDLINQKKVREEKLYKETCQYQTVQKKVLTNMKDVTPKTPSNLYKILKDTSNMILSSIDVLEELENELSLSRTSVASISRMMVTLLELMGVSGNDLKVLKTVFSPNVHDTEEQGWLEVQEAAASFLLRTALAKSTKDQQKPTDILLEAKSDSTKLTRHFSTVIERVTKGTHLLERNEFESKKEPLPTIHGVQEWEESFTEEIIPRGLKFLELAPLEDKKQDIIEKKKPEKENKITTKEVLPPLVTVTKPESQEPKETNNNPDVKEPEESKPETRETKKLELPRVEEEDEHDDDDDAIWDVKIEEMTI